MNKIDMALNLKSFVEKRYNLEIGEIASLEIIKYIYENMESHIYHSLKSTVKKEVTEELINTLKEVNTYD